MGKSSQYGVILDAGSSGTRLYVYKWKNHAAAAKDASTTKLKSLPEIKLEKSKKIHPGVSSFAASITKIGPDHLQELIDLALDEVPHHKVPETPIYLMATAGMRLLPDHQQNALLQTMCTYLRANSKFILPDCDAHIQVISGETEGLYGWIAANYLLGGFDTPKDHNHGKDHHTYGFLDMGGASAQIAFAPNSTESVKHANDLKLVRMRNLDGSPAEYKVFTSTWLGFGANKARDRFVESLQEAYSGEQELPDPCMPKGLRTTLTGEPVDGKSKDPILVGTGLFDECLRKTHPLLNKELPCEDQPCLINGQHVPAIDFDINHFVGVSEYWHTTHGVFGGKHKAYDLATYQNNVMEFCSREWEDIEDDMDLEKRKKSPEEKAQEARQACFKASWLINMLYDGIGIPRVGLEGGVGSNSTKDNSDHEKGFADPFRPMDKIDGVELSWTLGKMVLYAAGQVPPSSDDGLPVGFGSNVESGKPEDFELAGSVPIPANLGSHDDDDDDDWDDLLEKPSGSTSGIVAFIFILLVLAFILRKPERRRRLFSLARRRHRSSGGRKSSRGFSLANKIFGRNTPAYERVMEEGDLSDFELGDVDSDEDEHSDSSEETSRQGRASGLATPQFSGRVDELRPPPSAMDRSGLVVRTESRERLSLQTINAGRRSRNVSPIRSKSPFMTPLAED